MILTSRDVFVAYTMMAEKVLVENNGVFELVNASEVLCLDSSGGLDVTTPHKANIGPQDSISVPKPTEPDPAQIDLKLEDGFQPPSEANPAHVDLNQESFLPSSEVGPVEIRSNLKLEVNFLPVHVDLKLNKLLTPTGTEPVQIDLNLEGGPSEAEPILLDLKLDSSEAKPAKFDLNLDCSETGSTNTKKGLSPSNYQDMKLEPTVIQFGIATHEQQRPMLQNKSPLGQAAGAEDVGRRKMNDAAFFVWLARKKELQAAKQKAAENAERASREERERRARQSKIAFEVWLAQKTQKDAAKEKKPSPVLTSARQSLGPSAFEIWMRNKREEHVKKVQIENERLERQEEAAKRVDHNIASKVFSRYSSIIPFLLYYFYILFGSISSTITIFDFVHTMIPAHRRHVQFSIYFLASRFFLAAICLHSTHIFTIDTSSSLFST